MRVKLRNLYLGIKDQLPFKRLVRNTIKGHVFGLFSTRSHLTAQDKPKVAYRTKASAIFAASAMKKKTGTYFSNYKCIFCDGYHLGRNRDNK